MPPIRPAFALLAVFLLACCATASVGADELDWLSGQAVATNAEPNRILPATSLRKVGAALAIVLGGFFLLTVVMRKQSTSWPANEMMEPLGSVQITPKVRLHLVRFGARILVLHISGQNVQRVAEVDDPKEVHQLLATHDSDSKVNAPISVSSLLQSVEHSSSQTLQPGWDR